MQKISKARGNPFFSFTETFPYHTDKTVLGQNTLDSCVAAICRMILADNGIEVSEYHLRNDLKIDTEGASLQDIPEVLRLYGLRENYQFTRNLTLDDLREFTITDSVFVNLRKPNQRIGHAVVIDGFEKIEGELYVLVRDSLPLMLGTAYKIKAKTFWLFWKRLDPTKMADFGNAVVVK